MSKLGLLICCVCVLGLSGCETLSALNPFGGDDEEGPADLVDFEPEADVRFKWDVQIGSGVGDKYISLTPALGNGRVIGADAYGRVEARDMETGKRIWQTRVGEPAGGGFFESLRFWASTDYSFVSGGVGGGDGAVFVGTIDGEVIALDDLSGDILWRSRVTSEVLDAPATNGDVVVVQTLDGKLAALDRETGERRWTYDTQVPVLSLRGTGEAVFDGPLVFNGFPSGRVVAIRAAAGEPVWEQRVAAPQGRSELDRMVDVDGRVLVSNGVVFAASYQGRLKALRVANGDPIWEKDASSHQSLASGLGQIYLVDKDDVLVAVDQTTANSNWQSDILKRRQLTSPVVVGNYVVVGDADGYLHVFAQSDGRYVARRRIDSDGLRSDLRVSGDVVYGLSVDGTLFAVTIELRS